MVSEKVKHYFVFFQKKFYHREFRRNINPYLIFAKIPCIEFKLTL